MSALSWTSSGDRMTDGMTDEAKKWRGWATIWFIAFLISFIGLMYLGYRCNGLSGLGI